MRRVEFLDTSLRDGEQTPGVNFSIKEKVAIARQLEKWGISAIEAGFPAASPDSFLAVQEIAKVLKKTAVNESGLAAGKPASIAEMPHFSSCLAMAIFSLIEKLTPGVCSPSRRLVSRNSTVLIRFPLFQMWF